MLGEKSHFLPGPPGREKTFGFGPVEFKDFFDFINACFSHRRKKLVNSLSQSGSRYCDKAELVIELLSGINKNRDVRAEELTLDDYIYLYKELNT